MSQHGKSPLFEDLEEAVTVAKAGRKPIDPAVIQQVSEAQDFPSRERKKVATVDRWAAPAAKKPDATPERKSRRFRTGRNIPVNIKLDQPTKDALYRLSDELDLPLGEVVERALKRLQVEVEALRNP